MQPPIGILRLLAAFTLLTPLAGCWVRTELAAPVDGGFARVRTQALVGTSDWPQTWEADQGKPKGVIVPLAGPLSIWQGVHLGEHHFLHAGEVERQDAALLASGLDEPKGFQFRAEGPGSFVFIRDPRFEGPDAPPPPVPGEAGTAELFKVVMGWPSEPWNAVDRVRLERCWLALYDPMGRPAEQTKGLVLVMPGMFGTPEPMINSLIGTLRRRGWSVLRMLSHPSRFTERLEVEIVAGREDELARDIATELGQNAAGVAYAAQLALDHAQSLRPGLASKPTALLGMSGGAIVLPTVHALAPDRYDAAVLIAGGVNFLEINLRSNYADWIEALVIDFDDTAPGVQKPRGEQVLEMSRLYLDHAPLDGAHLAPLLAGKPTLMLHGSADRAVPADLGQRLWELAGQPERWTLPVGHELIFAALPFQAARIERWLTDSLITLPTDPADPGVVRAPSAANDP
ncbi:MAG: putative esterase [Phycisphaerales bacterium]